MKLHPEGEWAMGPNPEGGINTPLHCAVFIGNIEIIKLLLEYDIDIDAVDIDGDSALLLAVHEKNAEIVETLLQKGANVNFQDEDLRTALFYATPKMAKLIFDHATNLDLELRDENDRNTVFEHTLDIKKFEILKMITFHQIMKA